MNISIIKHNTADYELLIQLRIHTLLLPIGVPATYIDRQKEKDDVFIGAFENNELIGGCVLTLKEPSVFQLRQMAVRADYQGRNVGAEIISYAEKLSREMKIAKIILNARDPVIGFYEKSGYHIEGEQFFEVGLGHHRMVKELR